MSPELESIVLGHLRAMSAQLATINDREVDVMQRLGNLSLQLDSILVRAARLDAGLERIERRLGSIERV